MTRIVVNEKFAAIIDAISYWLGYQFKIGRNQLIHEASLRYPIADTITAKETGINQVVLEQLHPIFKSKKINLAIFKKNTTNLEKEKSDKKLTEVYEFKLAKLDTSKLGSDEHQRVFDDVVRLAYYHKWRKKDCYFLMCGIYEDFKTYFVGQKSGIQNINGTNTVTPIQGQNKTGFPNIDEWEADGLYKDWFGFSIGEEKTKEFIIINPLDDNEWGLNSFKKNYKIRDELKQKFTNSIIIKTKCMAITPNGLGINRTHAAGIWKIESVSKGVNKRK